LLSQNYEGEKGLYAFSAKTWTQFLSATVYFAISFFDFIIKYFGWLYEVQAFSWLVVDFGHNFLQPIGLQYPQIHIFWQQSRSQVFRLKTEKVAF